MPCHRPFPAPWKHALAALLVCLHAAAAPAAAAPPATPLGPNPPRVEQRDGIAYLSGGIGADEAARMRSMRAAFNVQMQFADARTGEWLSDVAVALADARGKPVFSLVTSGPFLYVKLPPGSYRARITYQGVSQTRKFTAGRKPAALDFRIAVNDAERSWLYCGGGCKPAGR